MQISTCSVLLVGAGGAVGRELLSLLEQRQFPLEQLTICGSERSQGVTLPYAGASMEFMPLDQVLNSPSGCIKPKIAFLAVDGPMALQIAPRLVAAGYWVIDNSSAFRDDPQTPLVIPEVNPQDLPRRELGPRLIANPNCTTILSLLALTPLRRRFGLERVQLCSYQAMSGAGAAAMEALYRETAAVLAGHPPEATHFHEPCAFNVFSHDSAVDPLSGQNAEEMKLSRESARLWGDASTPISATCMRVPTQRAHLVAIHADLRQPASIGQLRSLLEQAPGVSLVDDRLGNRFPTALKASHQDLVLVGRLRAAGPAVEVASTPQSNQPHYRHIALLVAGDQLRKGAALNALQIAERL